MREEYNFSQSRENPYTQKQLMTKEEILKIGNKRGSEIGEIFLDNAALPRPRPSPRSHRSIKITDFMRFNEYLESLGFCVHQIKADNDKYAIIAIVKDKPTSRKQYVIVSFITLKGSYSFIGIRKASKSETPTS